MSLKKRSSPASVRTVIDATLGKAPSGHRWAVAAFCLIALGLVFIEGMLWASSNTKLDKLHAAEMKRELAMKLPALHVQATSQFAGLRARLDELSARWKADTGVQLTPGKAPSELPATLRRLLANPKAKSAADCWDSAWQNLPTKAALAERTSRLDVIRRRLDSQFFEEDDGTFLKKLVTDVEQWSLLATDAEECSQLIAQLLRLSAESSPMSPKGAR